MQKYALTKHLCSASNSYQHADDILPIFNFKAQFLRAQCR